MTKQIERIGIISDMHCGSLWGLLPPEYWCDKTPEATRELWGNYVDFTQHLKGCDMVILNGDLIDGKQYRSDGTGVVTTSMKGQTEIACECVKLFASDVGMMVRLAGTPYHETFDGPLAWLDEKFDIPKPKNINNEIFMDIDIGDGVILNVKHEPEGATALYRGTTMDRELLWAKIAEALQGIPNATFIVRSHVHSFATLGNYDKEIIQTPCWQLQSPYAIHKRMYRWQPDIGGIIMQRDARSLHGWIVYPVRYKLPKIDIIPVEDLRTKVMLNECECAHVNQTHREAISNTADTMRSPRVTLDEG